MSKNAMVMDMITGYSEFKDQISDNNLITHIAFRVSKNLINNFNKPVIGLSMPDGSFRDLT